MSEPKSVYIISAEAKDLYLENYSNAGCTGYSAKYKTGDRTGELRWNRFSNTLDYSLDLIRLREVYTEAYKRRTGFSMSHGGKEYCQFVINVTFKYAVKVFNRWYGGVWVRFGYTPEQLEFNDCIAEMDGEIAGIRTGEPVDHPVDPEKLPKWFAYQDGEYVQTKPLPTAVTVAGLRKKLYEDGFVCDGMQFVRFKRSSGSSRVGKCLFIDSRLYPRMHRWELCGLPVKQGQETDLAALEAYIALTLSSIVDTLELKPENFLVIDDWTSTFQDRVIAVRAGEDGWLTAQPEDVQVENNIWDGQSLIDPGVLGRYGQYGMVLLRNRFFKSACFNCSIQQWFADNGITDVSQLNGRTCAESIEDIKVITTPSSIKFLKFGSLEDWLQAVREFGKFGIVKHEKPTHFFDGRMVQVHYQLLNTLQMTEEDVDRFVQPSLDYLQMIKSDPAVLRYHIKFSAGTDEVSAATTSNDVVYMMLGITDRFAQTRLYQQYVKNIVVSFKKHLRRGHVLVSGNYSTLLGNPAEMLQASIGAFNGSPVMRKGTVSSSRFEPGQTLLGSRSPHVTMGNIFLAENARYPEIEQYFNLTDEIVCVNSIGENILMRLSGCDFDSDTMLLTDNPILIAAAQKNYSRFLVPTSLVKARKVVRHYTAAEQADLDVKTSVNKIGEIVNLSQELNTRFWDQANSGVSFEELEELYCDIAKLDILSGIEIDKAKKEFTVDSVAELRRMRQKYTEFDEEGRRIKPNFLGKIARYKGFYDSKKNNYAFHRTTMDFLQRSVNRFRVSTAQRAGSGTKSADVDMIKTGSGKYTGSKPSYIPFSDLLIPGVVGKPSWSQIDRITGAVREMRRRLHEIWAVRESPSNMGQVIDRGTSWNATADTFEKTQAEVAARNECRRIISSMDIALPTAYRLLKEIESPRNADISKSLFSMLFSVPCDAFIRCLQEQKEPVQVLEECPDGETGDIQIYNFQFRKTAVARSGQADL